MNTSKKAIETHYKGCRFRSRLEARWAVFFDALGIEWLYEPEGFEVTIPYNAAGDTATYRYLPDFYLPKLKVWAEVKGRLIDNDTYDMAMILDWCSPMPHICDSHDASTGGLLMLGDVPDGTSLTVHPIVTHCEGLWRQFAFFTPAGLYRLTDKDMFLLSFFSSKPPPHTCHCDGFSSNIEERLELFDPTALTFISKRAYPEVNTAYVRARSARFEFGEQHG